MENQIKRIFRSSVGSCRPRNLSDTVEKAVYQKDLLTTTTDHHLRPPRVPFPSICRITTQVNDLSIIPKQKISDRYPPFVSADSSLFPLDFAGEKVPVKTRKTKNKKKKSKSRNRSSRDLGSHFFTSSSLDTTYFDDWWFSSSSDGEQTDNDGEKSIRFLSKSLSSVSSRRFQHRPTTGRRRSELGLVPPLEKRATAADIDSYDGEEAYTLFSPKSLSSESARRFQRRPTITKGRSEVGVFPSLENKTAVSAAINSYDSVETNNLFSSKSLFSESTCRFRHQPTIPKRRSEVSVLPPSENRTTDGAGDDKMKDSLAVVKSSSDPYNDFRNSMVEMIIEKQIFAAKDLENLLKCFLNLNSDRHHGIIVEVFSEILETLFL